MSTLDKLTKVLIVDKEGNLKTIDLPLYYQATAYQRDAQLIRVTKPGDKVLISRKLYVRTKGGLKPVTG